MHGLDLDRFKAICQEENVGVGWEFTERPAPTFDIFQKSTSYHVADCPVRCPHYKGKYRAENCKLPVATEILNRVMYTGVVERKPSDVKQRCKAIRRAIKRMESE